MSQRAEESALRKSWESTYESDQTPFDVDAPDEWIAELEREGQIGADVLDCGCGPGRTAMYLAERGHRVLGIDISQNAIERARQKAAARHIAVEFRREDALRLSAIEERFDAVVDIGCFHSLYSDADRRTYAAELHRVCRDGGRVFLRAFSDRDAGDEFTGMHSPRRKEADVRSAFDGEGWIPEMLEERRIQLFISPEVQHQTWAWFAILRRSSAASPRPVSRS